MGCTSSSTSKPVADDFKIKDTSLGSVDEFIGQVNDLLDQAGAIAGDVNDKNEALYKSLGYEPAEGEDGPSIHETITALFLQFFALANGDLSKVEFAFNIEAEEASDLVSVSLNGIDAKGAVEQIQALKDFLVELTGSIKKFPELLEAAKALPEGAMAAKDGAVDDIKALDPMKAMKATKDCVSMVNTVGKIPAFLASMGDDFKGTVEALKEWITEFTGPEGAKKLAEYGKKCAEKTTFEPEACHKLIFPPEAAKA